MIGTYKGTHRRHVVEKDINWQALLEAHKKFFLKKYLDGFSGNIAESEINPEPYLKNMKFSPPIFPELDCIKVDRVKAALGPDWTFGVPFGYRLDKESEKVCGPRKLGDGSPANEGSHGGFNAFPSLNGVDLED